MKKLKVMMMTLMMCLVSISAWGEQENKKPIVNELNIINPNIVKINSDTIYSNNGTIYYIKNTDKIFKFFNLQGIDVTELNGSLISGVYIVVINDEYVGNIYVGKIFVQSRLQSEL